MQELIHKITKRTSFEEFEKQRDNECLMNSERYLKLKTEFEDGDELYYYDDIGCLCGSAGILTVRNGVVMNVYCYIRS